MSQPPTISRATLRIARPTDEARRATAPYLVHQAVADLFGDRADRGYLYRELSAVGERVEVLILSADPPQPVEALTSPAFRCALSVESKPFEPRFAAGQLLDFELRANATRVVTGPDGKKRKDVWDAVWGADPKTPASPHEVYGEWLRGKLDKVADVLATRVTERGEVVARRGAGAARFIGANLIGTLEVVDPAGLTSLLSEGIGRAKAFGCGLLCLSRPGTILPRRHPDAAAALLR